MNPIINQRHETYWNLHKDVFSVRVKGRVVQHIRSAFVRNVTFAVQPAGRAKVLLEQRKNVHAFVRGDRMKYCSTGDAIYEADRACFVIRDNKPEIYAWNMSDKEL